MTKKTKNTWRLLFAFSKMMGLDTRFCSSITLFFFYHGLCTHRYTEEETSVQSFCLFSLSPTGMQSTEELTVQKCCAMKYRENIPSSCTSGAATTLIFLACHIYRKRKEKKGMRKGTHKFI